MKTNHRRGYVDPGSAPRWPYRVYADRHTGAWAVVHDAPYGGHRGVAGRRAAAKRRVVGLSRRLHKQEARDGRDER